jgi:methanethiol S-methyltransferase
MRILALVYGLIGLAVGAGISLVQIAFVGNYLLPKTIDRGSRAVDNPVLALAIDLFLVALFGLQHSLMARPWFKKWWTRVVPVVVERSTYMIFVGLAYGLLFHCWQPVETVVWQFDNPVVVIIFRTIFWAGWILLLWASNLISPLDVWGFRQVLAYVRGVPYEGPVYQVAGPFRVMRHPIMLGLFMAFWSSPLMTLGHLIFALGMTGYVVISTRWEEADLVREYPDYDDYRKSTSSFFPWPRRKH